jgi:hypothetical protein
MVKEVKMTCAPMFGITPSGTITANYEKTDPMEHSDSNWGSVKIGYKNIEYKYDESMYINEIMRYIDKTYGEHYSLNKFQATEFIIDSGHGTGFCIGNVLKYAQRYGKKGTDVESRKDLMKVIHYAIMQLYVHDKQNKQETN